MAIPSSEPDGARCFFSPKLLKIAVYCVPLRGESGAGTEDSEWYERTRSG